MTNSSSQTSVDPSVNDAIARLHAAMAKVAMGDVSAIKALYSHTAEATSFFGWGGYEKGRDGVSRRWDWAGQQFKGGGISYESDLAFQNSGGSAGTGGSCGDQVRLVSTLGTAAGSPTPATRTRCELYNPGQIDHPNLRRNTAAALRPRDRWR